MIWADKLSEQTASICNILRLICENSANRILFMTSLMQWYAAEPRVREKRKKDFFFLAHKFFFWKETCTLVSIYNMWMMRNILGQDRILLICAWWAISILEWFCSQIENKITNRKFQDFKFSTEIWQKPVCFKIRLVFTWIRENS